MKAKPRQPPRAARSLLRLLLPSECRPGAQHDLDEKYRLKMLPLLGRRQAAWWYWKQVLALLHPRFWPERAAEPAADLRSRFARLLRSNPVMNILQDLRFGIRMLAKTPGITLAAVLALALGIGANGTIYTFLRTVALTPLPVEEPDRLLFLDCQNQPQGQYSMEVSYLDYLDWSRQNTTFQDLAAYTGWTINLTDSDGVPERLEGLRATPNIFGILGHPPVLGRPFSQADTLPSSAPVALIGYATWQRRYGGDKGVIGKTIRVNEVETTVIGVLSSVLEKTPFQPGVWIPLRPSAKEQEDRQRRLFQVIGRLADNVTAAQARQEMDTVGKRLAEQHPETNQDVSVLVQTYHQVYTEDANKMIAQIMMASVALVLLIACANVANLLLARSAVRSRETAIRSAMGAGRWRLFRQLFLESLLLSLLGGTVGLLLAVWGSRAFESAIAKAGPPVWWDFSLDAGVLGFLALLCLGTTLLFGTVPALRSSRVDVNEALKEGGRGQSSGRRHYSRLLVPVQLALTLALLAGAGLMIRTALNAQRIDFGIQTDRNQLLTARLRLSEERYPEAQDRIDFHRELARRIRAIPGVESAAMASTLPGAFAYSVSVEIEGRPSDEGRSAFRAAQVIISPGYFKTLGTGVTRGRDFDERDGGEGEPVTIVDPAFAQRFWPDEDPVGKRIRFVGESDTRWMRVVGVSPPLMENPPADILPNRPALYTPYRQEPVRTITWVARSPLETEQLTRLLRREVAAADPNLPLFDIRTVEQIVLMATLGFRVVSVIFALLSGAALLLSSIGLYAVIAHSVSSRRREIGIRMALGARAKEVLRMVLGEGLKAALWGLLLGLAGAFALSRALAYFVIGVSPSDPTTFVSIVALMLAVVLSASLIPARRAGRVDPSRALRME